VSVLITLCAARGVGVRRFRSGSHSLVRAQAQAGEGGGAEEERCAGVCGRRAESDRLMAESEGDGAAPFSTPSSAPAHSARRRDCYTCHRGRRLVRTPSEEERALGRTGFSRKRQETRTERKRETGRRGGLPRARGVSGGARTQLRELALDGAELRRIVSGAHGFRPRHK
jgi:hypothetical protein